MMRIIKSVLNVLCSQRKRKERSQNSKSYVDDVVQAGTAEFGRLTNHLSVNYDAKAKIYGYGRIAGIEFQRDSDCIRVNQSQYLRSLRPLPTDATFEDLGLLE
jgi:DNA-directed RNA polymerase specialized sigma subunit